MNKIILIAILIFATNIFSQNVEKKSVIEEMNNYYNKGKIEKLEFITNEILSGKYGDLDDELRFYTLMYSSNVYTRDEYLKKDSQKGYDKSMELLNFAETTSYAIPNKDVYIKSMSDFLINLKNKHPEIIINDVKPNYKTVSSTKQETTNNSQKELNDNKSVTLTVSGTGKTLEEARLNALRSAIEQAFGAFISSKTEILNDKLIKDEIVSVASGNVEKYDIISQVEVPLVGFATTLNATVSIAKLTSFAESKGVVVEFKGGVFGLNMKLQKLNEKNELKSAIEILGIVHESLQNSFDYKIDVGSSPQFVNENLYKLPISVSVYSNDNYEKIIGYLIKSLKALSMDNAELDNYKKINKKVFEIKFYLDDKYAYQFYLRNEYSFQTISNIFKSWEFYLGNYRVSNNVNSIDGPDLNTELLESMRNNRDIMSLPFTSYNGSNVGYENGIKNFSKEEYKGENYNKSYYNSGNQEYNSDVQVFFTFPWTKEKIVIFSWDQPYKLNEIEKLTNFEVKSKGIISQFSNGGFLLHEINGGKIIASPYEINTIDSERITNNIGNLLWSTNNPTSDSYGTSIENTEKFAQAGEKTIGVMMNKFNKSQSTNWSIPSAKESLLMYIKLKKIGILRFYQYKYYLSSTLPRDDNSNAYTYVISEDLGSIDELYSDFINNLKIPVYDFIDTNYKKYLTKCRDGQDVIIKPIKYVTN